MRLGSGVGEEGAIKQSMNEEAIIKPIILYAISVWGSDRHGGMYPGSVYTCHVCGGQYWVLSLMGLYI